MEVCLIFRRNALKNLKAVLFRIKKMELTRKIIKKKGFNMGNQLKRCWKS